MVVRNSVCLLLWLCWLRVTPRSGFVQHADSVWADFNNDGWIDLLAVDRHETGSGFGVLQNVMFMNQGDGTFAPLRGEISGINENSIGAETADLNGDGLLDLYFLTDIGNSYPIFQNSPSVPRGEFLDKIYWNTGEHGGKDNNWVTIRLGGKPQRQLVGSKLTIYDSADTLLGRRDLFPVTSYKSSNHLEVHFGLGQTNLANLSITLPNGDVLGVTDLPINALIEVDVSTGAVSVIREQVTQLPATSS